LVDLKTIEMQDGASPIIDRVRNLLECHAAWGPVSASPSPATQAAMRSGIVEDAPERMESEYRVPSFVDVRPGSMAQVPPGKNCLKSFFMPSASRDMGIKFAAPSDELATAGTSMPGPQMKMIEIMGIDQAVKCINE
jgi:hypothetical protein